jgi:hypothetical protein
VTGGEVLLRGLLAAREEDARAEDGGQVGDDDGDIERVQGAR